MESNKVEAFEVSDIKKGTTTDSYVDALDWDCRAGRDKSMLLKNTHGSNGLKYKLLGAMAYSGQTVELVPETTLAAGETAKFQYVKACARLKLQVKAAVASSQATYQVDYISLGI